MSRKINTEIESSKLKRLLLIELAKIGITQGQFFTQVTKNFLKSRGVEYDNE